MQRVTKAPEVRRHEIIDTAISLFIEKGYEQTSMLDITKSINVSPGLFYRYFKSKEEIYQAVIDTYVSQGIDIFLSMIGDENQTIVDTIDTMQPLSDLKDDNNIYHKFFNLQGNSNFHIQMELALVNKLVPFIAERLALANTRGEINIDNSIAIATYYLYGQLGIWQMEGIESEVKVEQVRNYTKKLLGV